MSICVAVTALTMASCSSDSASKATTASTPSTGSAASATTAAGSATTEAAATTEAGSATTEAGSATTEAAVATTEAGTATSGGSSTAAPTGTPITLMVTGLLKSPIGSFEQSVSAAEAAAKAINASGGVGGHPIAVVTCDDGGAAAKAAQCAQQAVDTKVAAIVGSVFLVPDYFPILEGAKIPFVGGAAPLPQESASPLAYPLTSGASGEFSAMGAWVASNIGKNVAIFAADNPTGAYTSGAIEATATAAGATVSVVKAPAGAPDFSPFASNILSSNPDVVVLALVPTDVVPAVQALRGQGYTGPIANIQSTLNQAVIDALGSAAEGVTTFSSWALPDATTSKLMDRFNKEMAEYAPDAARDGFSESAWSAVNAIAAALKGSTAVDAAAVVAGLDANKIDLVGMAGGAPFAVSATSGVSKDKPRIFNPYVVVYRVKAGKFEQIQDFYDPITNPTGKAAG